MFFSRDARAMASHDPTAAKSISLALGWLNKLHERRVNNSTGEHVSASQVANDEFSRRLEHPDKRLRPSAIQRSIRDHSR